MEKSSFKGRILQEIEKLISSSCATTDVSLESSELHQNIVKNHYNAAKVVFDYQRQRIAMDIVVDDSQYDPKTVNTDLSVMRANFWFKNLKEFLKGCLQADTKSLAFYASLLRDYNKKEVPLVSV